MPEQVIHEVLYIRTSREMLWRALTDPDMTEQYWGKTRIESDWRIGSKILYKRRGDITDEHIIEAIEAPRRLVHSFRPLFGEFAHEQPSRVTFELAKGDGIVRLTVIHDNFPPASKVYAACREGWPKILSSLKSMLETGRPIDAFNVSV